MKKTGKEEKKKGCSSYCLALVVRVTADKLGNDGKVADAIRLRELTDSLLPRFR